MGERLLRGQTFTRNVQEVTPPQQFQVDALAAAGLGGGGATATLTKPAGMQSRQIQTQGAPPLLNFLADFATSFGAGPQAAQNQIGRRQSLLQQNLDTQQGEIEKKNAFLLKQIEEQTPEFRVLANGDVAVINKQALQGGDFNRAFTIIPNPSKLKPEQIKQYMDKMSEDLGLSKDESVVARMAAIEALEKGDPSPLRTVASQIVTQRNIAERQDATATRSEERQQKGIDAAFERQQRGFEHGQNQLLRSLNERDSPKKLLSPDEAGRLSVPYGTTREQAFGKTPRVGTGNLTAAENDNYKFYNRARSALTNISSLEKEIQSMGFTKQLQLEFAPNWMQSETGQLYRQAQRAFTEARLRDDSGAAVPVSEYDADAKTYFAQPGDTKETLEQKRKARIVVLKSMYKSAGRATEGEPSVDELFGGSSEKIPQSEVKAAAQAYLDKFKKKQ